MKKIVIAGVALVVLAGGGVLAYTKLHKPAVKTAEGSTKKKLINEPVNVIAVEERPYLQIIPQADGHNLVIAVQKVKKSATNAQYELEYQAGSLLQGAFGEIPLSSVPASTKVLLGSCSAGGACTYHEDVQGGTLVTKYEGPENYALKSRWKYIDNLKKGTSFSSQDAMFQIDSKDLAAQRFLVIFNTAGYPDGLKSKPASELYSLTSSGTLKGTAKLTIRAEQEDNLAIVGYDGKSWKEFETKVDGKQATATVDLMELYTVIAK